MERAVGVHERRIQLEFRVEQVEFGGRQNGAIWTDGRESQNGVSSRTVRHGGGDYDENAQDEPAAHFPT